MEVKELSATEVANVIGEMLRESDRLRLFALHAQGRPRMEAMAHADKLSEWAHRLQETLPK